MLKIKNLQIIIEKHFYHFFELVKEEDEGTVVFFICLLDFDNLDM
jgi:hypothetical protein